MDLQGLRQHSSKDFFGLTERDRVLLNALRAVPIPSDEEKRITVLRQSLLLDSEPNEPTFDRLTAMAQRLFDVPVVTVALVDVNRCWFKSKVGLPASMTHEPRDQSFSAFAVLPEGPEVFVIEDTTLDPRYAEFPTVPATRFYAGAALIVDDVRVGALCLSDSAPRTFDLKDQMNLLDLGNTIADMIAERRRKQLKACAERATLMLTMMHGLRTPVFAMDIGTKVLATGAMKDNIVTALRRQDPSHRGADVYVNTVKDLDVSVDKLKLAVESTVVLGKALAATPSLGAIANTAIKKLTTEVVDTEQLLPNADTISLSVVISQLKNMSKLVGKRNLVWDCEPAHSSAPLKTYPDALNFVLVSVLTHIVSTAGINPDTSSDPIHISVKLSACYHSSVPRPNRVGFDEEEVPCYICNNAASTVCVPHGGIVLTIATKSTAKPTNCVAARICVDQQRQSFASKLTLNPIILQVMERIGGKYDSAVVAEMNGHKKSDVFHCEIPYLLEQDAETENVQYCNIPVPITAQTSPSVGEVAPIPVDESKGNHMMPTFEYGNKITLSKQNTSPQVLNVLVVDDSIMIQKMLRKWLESDHCIVSCAPNGKIGLSMMQSNEYDLVLMDFLMPVMLGLDCLKEFQDWKSTPEYEQSRVKNANMLVIGMSATASEEEQQFGFNHGTHFYSPKPVALDSLKFSLACIRKSDTIRECVDLIAASSCYARANDSMTCT
jgi:CheY-like chemotaxis protein